MNNNALDFSFENFLNDIIVRSFESYDWINEELDKLNINACEDLVNLNEAQRDNFYILYNSMRDRLFKNVIITDNNNTYSPEEIYYHKRFGWVLYNNNSLIRNEIKIYLGKISITEGTKIFMGKRSYISGASLIRGGGEVIIGSFSSLAENINIMTSSNGVHPMHHAAMVNLKKNLRVVEDGFDMDIQYSELDNLDNKVTIGNDVWIGRNVRIRNGVRIGDGCVIGEGSLVLKDCLNYGVYAGHPAKLIRFRFSEEIIQQLLEVKWWDWNMEKVLKNKDFFQSNLTQYEGNLMDVIFD